LGCHHAHSLKQESLTEGAYGCDVHIFLNFCQQIAFFGAILQDKYPVRGVFHNALQDDTDKVGQWGPGKD